MRECLSFVPHSYYLTLTLVTSSDRDAKQKWANNVASGAWNLGISGIGSQFLTGAVKKGVGRVFGP